MRLRLSCWATRSSSPTSSSSWLALRLGLLGLGLLRSRLRLASACSGCVGRRAALGRARGLLDRAVGAAVGSRRPSRRCSVALVEGAGRRCRAGPCRRSPTRPCRRCRGPSGSARTSRQRAIRWLRTRTSSCSSVDSGTASLASSNARVCEYLHKASTPSFANRSAGDCNRGPDVARVTARYEAAGACRGLGQSSRVRDLRSQNVLEWGKLDSIVRYPRCLVKEPSMPLLRTIHLFALALALAVTGVGVSSVTIASGGGSAAFGASRPQARAMAHVVRERRPATDQCGAQASRPATARRRQVRRRYGPGRWSRIMAARDRFRHQSMRSIKRACHRAYVGENIAMGQRAERRVRWSTCGCTRAVTGPTS